MVCPVCIAAPIALGGAFGVIASRKHVHLFNIYLFVTLIGMSFYYYYKYKNDDCKTCQ